MGRLLKLSGEEWLQSVIEGLHASSAPRYRLLQCATGDLTRSLPVDLEELMFDGCKWGAVPPAEVNASLNVTAFRMISCSSGVAQAQLLHSHSRCFPFKLIRAVFAESDEEARDIVGSSRACVRDSFSNDHLAKYSSTEALRSPESKAVLHGALVLARCDIGPIEARHASVRRAVMRSVQTWKKSLIQCGADWQLLRQRLLEQGLFPSRLAAKRRGRRHLAKPKKQRQRERKWAAAVVNCSMLSSVFGLHVTHGTALSTI